MRDEPVRAFIGLGGNLGNVCQTMNTALQSMHDAPGCTLTAISALYSTPPWGIEDQPRFLNACALLETRLDASALMTLIHEVENAAGRVRDQRWGPRVLDLDILMYGDEQVDLPGLTIPHPRMCERAFVMIPLADIAPDHVLAGQTVLQWIAQLDASNIEKTEAVLALPVS